MAQVYTWDKCRLGKNKWLKSLSIRYVFFQQFARAWYCLLPLLIEHTSHHYNTNPIHWTSKWFSGELFYCIQKAKTCNIVQIPCTNFKHSTENQRYFGCKYLGNNAKCHDSTGDRKIRFWWNGANSDLIILFCKRIIRVPIVPFV